MEAGPLSQWLRKGLVDAGFEVVLLETRHVKAALSAMTVKTDRKARSRREADSQVNIAGKRTPVPPAERCWRDRRCRCPLPSRVSRCHSRWKCDCASPRTAKRAAPCGAALTSGSAVGSGPLAPTGDAETEQTGAEERHGDGLGDGFFGDACHQNGWRSIVLGIVHFE